MTQLSITNFFLQRHKKTKLSPTRVIVISFFAVIMCGTALLMLPIATRDGQIPLVDALFTATSATCVTGLIVYDTYTKFTLFGQLVIISLIQIGGVGLVTMATFFNMLIGRKLGFKTMQLASESININSIDDVRTLVRIVVEATLFCEGIGALLLCIAFVPQFGLTGVGLALFTAISAFCNAGFDLFGRLTPFTSLTTFYDNPLVLCTVMTLIVFGGLGVVVWSNVRYYHRKMEFSFHTRLVLLVTGILIVFGTAAIAALEWNNPTTIGQMNSFDKILNAAFQSVTCRTAGFNSVDINSLNPVTKSVMTILMFIGAAPGGTGGGVKVTTFSVLVFTVLSVIRGRNETVVFGRRIPQSVVYKSITIIVLALLTLSISSTIVFFTSQSASVLTEGNVIFEMTSAFATVGLSTGITAIMNDVGKVVTSLMMFMGRVGPVSLAISLATAAANTHHTIIPEGKVIVG